MTKTEINVACARALGWKEIPDKFYIDRRAWIKDGKKRATPDFDFTESLDDCQQLRDALTDGQRLLFGEALWQQIDGIRMMEPKRAFFAISNATPEQICVAFLSAKGIK